MMNKKSKKKSIIIIVVAIGGLLLGAYFILKAIAKSQAGVDEDARQINKCLEECKGKEQCLCSSLLRSDKPILYFYPESETELTVKLGKPENLTASYPTYTTGWHVLAKPDSSLIDLDTGRSLYALYWEGISEDKPELTEGFVVSGSETTTFLEEKLALLGLTEREAEEFIVYWLPKMQENAYNLIRFETLEEINDSMPLNFSVEPDTLIRVMMDYQPLETYIEIPEQSLPSTPTRKGFTVVEWGGSEIAK